MKGKTASCGVAAVLTPSPMATVLFGVHQDAGNTADPDAFTDIIPVIRDTFALENLVLVGDRGMITTARIAALRELNDDPDTATDFGWITALRAPAIATLAADDGPLQMSLFDTQDLAEITHPDYPGERLIACRNPALAAERARKRHDLLAATEKLLAPIIARVASRPADRRRQDRHRGRQGDRTSTRWASTSTYRSPTPAWPSTATRPASTPKPPSTASTCCAPPSTPTNSTPPPWSTATRTSPTSNATSASSRPTTWTCAPSTTASTTASKPTC